MFFHFYLTSSLFNLFGFNQRVQNSIIMYSQLIQLPMEMKADALLPETIKNKL